MSGFGSKGGAIVSVRSSQPNRCERGGVSTCVLGALIAVALLVAGCGSERGRRSLGAPSIGPGVPSEAPPTNGPTGPGNGPSPQGCYISPPVIDGSFTDWEQGCIEWSKRVAGVFGDFYVAWTNDTLMVLNDWHLRDARAVEPDVYNLFQLSCPAGQMVIRVYGDQHIEAELNGEPLNRDMTGATGFESSPNNMDPHAIFEFSIESADAAACAMAALDPSNGTGTPEEVLTLEPTLFAFNSKGGFGFEAATTPKLVGSSPQTASAGEAVLVFGGLLGPSGDLRFGSTKAEIVSWSDTEVAAIVPALPPGPVAVTVMSEGQISNNLVFFSTCVPQCSGQECGDDGCGGICGKCLGTDSCVDGLCECVPACDGKQCGTDGCGGSCGSCSAGFSCQNQQCEPDFN